MRAHHSAQCTSDEPPLQWIPSRIGFVLGFTLDDHAHCSCGTQNVLARIYVGHVGGIWIGESLEAVRGTRGIPVGEDRVRIREAAAEIQSTDNALTPYHAYWDSKNDSNYPEG